MNLKRGKIPICGPADKQFGAVGFITSCSDKTQVEFDLAMALLHSFEYDEAEKAFAKVIDKTPDCAMAYWGVAMSNYHPLWAPPSETELQKGAKAVVIAQSIQQKSEREADYINAIAMFYKDWDKADHRTRAIRYEKAMEKLYKEFPEDKEAALFYALALTAAADPADKSFKNQKQAGALLNALYANEPNHPGVVHYIIHAFDSPELAELALPAARKYAAIAPSSAHALHMPSHIFTRLGLWDESIRSNLASVSSAQCYAEQTGIKGHWDEELHGLDYLVYAYLQKGQNELAMKQWNYLKTMNEVHPVNFKVAYAFASIPSRYLLENKMWVEAASLKTLHPNLHWDEYPWQKAIVHFTRVLGSVHTDNFTTAETELKNLRNCYDTLVAQKDAYKANEVLIQVKTAEAWLLFKQSKLPEALAQMYTAADMEDGTEKHPVTPGEVLPARELLGDMLLQMNKPQEALKAYEADLKRHHNRFNGLYGAGLAAEKSNNPEKAKYYYQQLTNIANATDSKRPELEGAKLYLNRMDVAGL
ncbi:Tetratricopeptide repeat protein [compost metagenome]